MSHDLFIPHRPPPAAHPNRTRQVLRHLARLAVAVAIVGLPGCDSPREVVEHRVIGTIDFGPYGTPPRIPETATAGVALEIVVTTRGAGCHKQGDTEVEVNGRSAVVTPYDILTTGYDGCYDIGKHFEHRTTVVFEEPGTAEIVLVYSTSAANYPEGHKGDGRKVYTVEVAEAG